MKITVTAENLESFEGRKGTQKTRRIIGIGADGDFAEQLFEINLPPDSPAIGVGKTFEFRARSIRALFGNKARLDGVLVPGGK